MYSSAYIWGKILGWLEEKLTSPVVSSWFDDAEVVELTDTRLILYSTSAFRKDVIERRGAKYIKDAMKELFDTDIELVVFGDDEMNTYREAGKKQDFIEFNPQYTFEKFVVGSSNRFAHAAALAVASNPTAPEGYNPLFIYGPSGLGKTHLLYAIASRIHKDHPEYNIVYIKAEQFTTELIAAIQSGRNIEFRNKYRGADLFLIDDIQFIAGKDSTQEEFFHTFNALYESHKTIVMTADRPPREMAKLEDRLLTRFQWGLITEINPPDYETRVAILKNNAMSLGIDLPEEVYAFIAENITSDVRKLEGAVKTINAYTGMQHTPIDVATTSRILKGIKPEGNAKPTPALITAEVCRFYSIEENVLRSNLKNKSTAEARQIAMYLIRNLTGLSYPDIGREFGKDHSTVMHAVNKVVSLLGDSANGIQDNIRDITSNINSKL